MTFQINEPVVIVGTIFLFLWAFHERILQVVGLRQGGAKEREKTSYFWLMFSFYGAMVFSFLDATVFQLTIVGQGLRPFRWVGVVLLTAGVTLRVVSRLTLGKQFSGRVQTYEEHRLVTVGIYRWVRHPLYLGYLLLLLGFPVCFGCIAGFVYAVTSGIPAILDRIRIEEAALEKWFPDEYGKYKSATSRLIPGVW